MPAAEVRLRHYISHVEPAHVRSAASPSAYSPQLAGHGSSIRSRRKETWLAYIFCLRQAATRSLTGGEGRCRAASIDQSIAVRILAG
ncbi:hypothetical protein CPAR01_05121 [Colletotrichum paranaense]|uniref:Uncharacterized protein n=1 Tax=Colletotrichum paranaense TaxID=1914294 RepID=A0ABQ9SR94_9PEZI|nr:uncharacterized protein CPAR01_05121 [Colletotrichum paranaense]KAK1541734.1 hypothetical protein CPAR01_05121 [Colletotrichum paranaense]